MKRIAKNLAILGTILTAGSANASMFADFSPYVGADYYQVWMQGKGQGELGFKNTFPKSYPGVTMYIGNKFTENFGTELGFDWSFRAKKNWTGIDDDGDTVSGTTKIRRIGGHIDLVGFLPIYECANLFGSVGFGWVKPKLDTQVTAPATETITERGKGNGVLRLGLGADWMATDMFGVRVKAGWENTARLRVRETSDSFSNEKFKAFKNSVTLAAGIFVKF